MFVRTSQTGWPGHKWLVTSWTLHMDIWTLHVRGVKQTDMVYVHVP